MEDVRWIERPWLSRPLVVAAFEGWNDAGEAASTAVGYLADACDARPLASLDPDEFYDYTVVRPLVRLDESFNRHIDWRTTEIAVGQLPQSDRDVVFIRGIEPNLRWRRFTDALAEVVEAVEAETVVTLGSLLAEVAHTQPVPITATAPDADVVEEYGLQPSRYEGPTGIIGVLHDRLRHTGVRSMSLWAAVPHYLRDTPSPKAALALLERLQEVAPIAIDTTDLDIAAAAYERQVSEVVASDTDIEAYVRRLELEKDPDGDDSSPPLRFRSADELAAEAERFLRDQGQ